MRYAGLKIRFGALVIDFIIFCMVFFPITRIVKGVWIMSPSDHRWASGLLITDPICIVFLVIIVAYYILLEGLFAATVGKMILGLRAIRIGGEKPGLWKAAVRNILRIIDSLPFCNILGAVLILRSPEKARFGDRIAGTRVIHTK